MTSNEIELLLYEEESATLDFKRDQYKFKKASEIEKSELLKDILGFANAWRRSDAYILIGIEEVRGGKSAIHGISEHLDDHSLQQFVNNLINRPLIFCYEASELDGKKIGVIRIQTQKRPFYLKKDYGKLRKEQVYVRRGSSISIDKPADLDEVSQMGADTTAEPRKHASFSVAVAHPQRDSILTTPFELNSEYIQLPNVDDIATLEDEPHRIESFGRTITIPALTSLDNQANEEYYREFAKHHFFHGAFTPIRAVVKNTSEISANDVAVEIILNNSKDCYLADYSLVPDSPKRRRSFSDGIMPKVPPGGLLRKAPGLVSVEYFENNCKFEITCGVVQPGRNIWSDIFYIAARSNEPFTLQGVIYSSDCGQPFSFEIPIQPTVSESTIDLEDLYRLADDFSE